MSDNENQYGDWRDREGTPIKKGDWITTPDTTGWLSSCRARDLEVKGQTPGGMLQLEANDGKPFKEWMLNWELVRKCLRNPILSPSN